MSRGGTTVYRPKRSVRRKTPKPMWRVPIVRAMAVPSAKPRYMSAEEIRLRKEELFDA